MIYEYFRAIGAHEIVLDFTDLFSSTTTFKILTPDGIRLCHQQVKFAMTQFLKVCT